MRTQFLRYRPRTEKLEQRHVLSGFVTATLSDGVLRIVGDEAANAVAVYSGPEPGEVFVAGGRGPALGATQTRVNGSLEPVLFTGVTVGTEIALNGGGDRLLLTNLTFGGNVTANLGAGHDVLTVGDDQTSTPTLTLNDGTQPNFGPVNITGSFHAAGLAGVDRFYLGHTDPATDTRSSMRSLFLGGGENDDLLSVSRLDVVGDLTWNDTVADSKSNVFLRELSVQGDIALSLTPFDDSVQIIGESRANPLTAEDVMVNSQFGNDLIVLRYADVENAFVNSGAGNDRLFVNQVDVQNELKLSIGNRSNEVSIANTTASRLSVIAAPSALATSVTLRNVFAIDSVIVTGNDRDAVAIFDSTLYRLRVNLNGGDDRIEIRNTVIDYLLSLEGGDGHDVFVDHDNNRINRRDVRNVEQTV